MKIIRLAVGELLANCYLLVSQNELLIIDPGGDEEKILKEIKKTKAKVKYIVATHCHPDHTLAIEKTKQETRAKVLIHQAEMGFIDFKADGFLNEGDEIKIGKTGLEVLHTPGHTKGSICLLGLQPPGKRTSNFIFTGDTLFKEGIGRTDLPGGSQRDLGRSLKRLWETLKPGMMVYPGHEEPFEYSRETKPKT